MPIASTNPATGETWRTYEPLTGNQVDEALTRATEAYAKWRATPINARRTHLLAAANLLEQRVNDLAELASQEMGKPVSAGRAEVLKCAKVCRFYADRAETFLADEPAQSDAVGARTALVRWQPLGPVLAVMPWNYPFWQALRFAAPALMAGNTVLLKHASNVPGCALAMQAVFHDAGFPDGAFEVLLVEGRDVAPLIADHRVAAVTITGSEAAGRAVGAAAGQAIKKVVLELGGSDPFIVMPSADINEAARVGATSRFQNSGQSCISAKRFIIHRDCYKRFMSAFVAQAAALVIGDPLQEQTQMGPLATPTASTELQDLVDDAVAHGADVLLGGKADGSPGWFYPPTVLAGVTPSMRIYREEAFGPIAAVIEVDNLDEAIEVANATTFGLGANAWTQAVEEQDQFVDLIDAGAVFINGMTTSYPELPFGGVKNSGHGRELAALGIREFCNIKTVWKA